MLKTSWRWTYRIALFTALLGGLLFASALLGLRYWLLPNIEQYRGDIAISISKAAGQRVTIGSIVADWRGLRPHVLLGDVRVYDKQSRPALSFSQIDTTLSWWSLFLVDIRLETLEINNPILAIRRDTGGRIFVAGIEVNRPDSGSGFADWILRQHQITVQHAVVTWQDDKRGAPLLTLNDVNLRLENGWNRHRFGLQASPPAAMAAPLDIRGDLRGESVQNFSGWRGTLYARLAQADFVPWKTWLPMPVDLDAGTGGAQLWLNLAKGKVGKIVADVNLAGVRTRLDAGLPELELKDMSGRLGWSWLQPGFEFQATNLRLATQNGITLPPFDGLVRFVPGDGKRLEEGEFHANRLFLGPLVALVDYLPLPQNYHAKLVEYEPRGSLRDFQLKWSGDWHAPARYAAKGGFVNLGLKPIGVLPGFIGISGNLDATEKGGTVSLSTRNASVEFPKLLTAPIALDTLTTQAGWKVKDGTVELRLTNLSLANKDLAGSIYGSYRTVSGTPGFVDLTGQFNRAEARQVARYLPLIIGESTRNWVAHAVQAGHSDNVRLRLRGNLADFPFVDDKKGVFEVTAKGSGGVLEYAAGWPKIENIALDLHFHGARMEILSQQGNTYGMGLAKVRVVIPDLLTFDEQLEVDGEARGPTADMLKFIANSPVNGLIDGLTEGMQATGNGTLGLKLLLPLRRPHDAKVAGSYQFMDNRILLGAGWPAVEKVNGNLAFTGDSVTIPRITANLLDGPATVSGGAQPDGTVRITAQGRAQAAGLYKITSQPVTRYLSGAADWRAMMVLRKSQADVTLDSSLVGLTSTLPPPFNKSTAVAIPLHVERKMTGPGQDTVSLGYGKILSAQFQRRRSNSHMQTWRGAISLGGTAVPAANGIWVTGELGQFDLDQWRAVLGPGKAGGTPGITGANLKFGTMDAFGKRFNNLRVSARSQNGGWQANLQGQEVNGDINWRPEGVGRVTARLRYLTIPEAAPAKIGVPAEAPVERDLPALDIVADEFQIKQKKMGKLELQAVQQAGDWRIEKLRLSSPDSTLQADGVWQGWRRNPHTKVNLHLDVKDIGKMLGRMGYPDSMKRGEAKLDGQLSWAGSPQHLDYSSLFGNMKLDAHNGQFLKIEPGIGKLLGILSLQALPRRITLDFRDVFSDGFAFDDITATMRVNRGVVSSDDFVMAGPAAGVAMKGNTNLADETQNLQVHVVPVLDNSVSAVGAFLGGPVVGITSFILQKLLKDPLGQIVSYDYRVTGTWDNPNVEKLGKSVGKAK